MLNRFFLLTGALFLLLAAGFYLLLGRQAKEALVEQMLHREQLSVRAGAKSLETFFALFTKSLAVQSTRGEIVFPGPTTNETLNEFSEKWADTPVAGVILTDASGVVRFNGNRDKAPEVGADLSDRDYFTWAKTTSKGSVYLSSPVVSRLGASKDKYIVVVAVPVVGEGGRFRGVLAASVILEELAQNHLNSLKISEKTQVYLVSEAGEVIRADQKEIVGVNFFEEMKKRPFLGSAVLAEKLKEILVSRQEGKLDVAYPLDLTSHELTRMLTAYAPVAVGENHLVLGLATPIDDALEYLAPFYFRNLGVAALAFLGFVTIAIRLAKMASYQEAVRAEHKIHGIGNNGNDQGFTLTEMIIVVTTILFLAVLTLSWLRNNVFKGNDAKRKGDIQRIQTAVEEYEKDNNCYPLPSLVVCTPGDTLTPYIDKIPCDPITNASYFYEYEDSLCPSWYRIYAYLENQNDADVTPVIGPYGAFNYYAASPNLPALAGGSQGGSATPTPTPSGGGGGEASDFYGCKSGVCMPILWDPARPGPECDPNYQSPTCYGQCGVPSTECQSWD